MPFHAVLNPPRFAPAKTIESFTCYRDAVVWCWENRVNQGAGEKMDQTLCANQIGLHTPHMSRCVNPDSQAPMNLSPDYIADFQAFCGWSAISQYMVRTTQYTLMEEVIEARRAA